MKVRLKSMGEVEELEIIDHREIDMGSWAYCEFSSGWSVKINDIHNPPPWEGEVHPPGTGYTRENDYVQQVGDYIEVLEQGKCADLRNSSGALGHLSASWDAPHPFSTG